MTIPATATKLDARVAWPSSVVCQLESDQGVRGLSRLPPRREGRPSPAASASWKSLRDRAGPAATVPGPRPRGSRRRREVAHLAEQPSEKPARADATSRSAQRSSSIFSRARYESRVSFLMLWRSGEPVPAWRRAPSPPPGRTHRNSDAGPPRGPCEGLHTEGSSRCRPREKRSAGPATVETNSGS